MSNESDRRINLGPSGGYVDPNSHSLKSNLQYLQTWGLSERFIPIAEVAEKFFDLWPAWEWRRSDDSVAMYQARRDAIDADLDMLDRLGGEKVGDSACTLG